MTHAVNVIDRDTQMCMSLAARPGNHGNRFHNFLYAELGLNFVYKSFNTTDLGATVAGVRSLGIRGVGVSMPYKEACMEFLDKIDESAQAIASVNTILNEDGTLIGYNTDYIAIRKMLASHEVPTDQDFAILGSGGMAKAVIAGLRDSGFTRGTIVSPFDLEGATKLGERYGFEAVAEIGSLRPRFILNATPVGMAGGPAENDLAFPQEVVEAAESVFDVVYMPPKTPLVKLATSLGKRVMSGAEVMRLQSLEQFVMYTGVRPTDEQIEKAEAYSWA